MAVRIQFKRDWAMRALTLCLCVGSALPAVSEPLVQLVEGHALGTNPAEQLGQGCAAAKGPDDPVSVRLAVLQAQANLSRSRNLSVGGTEKLRIANGAVQLVEQVQEFSATFQAPVYIAEQTYVKEGGVYQICVRIAERLPRQTQFN